MHHSLEINFLRPPPSPRGRKQATLLGFLLLFFLGAHVQECALQRTQQQQQRACQALQKQAEPSTAVQWSRLLEALPEEFPPEAWLEQLQLHEDQPTLMQGRTRSIQSMQKLVAYLRPQSEVHITFQQGPNNYLFQLTLSPKEKQR